MKNWQFIFGLILFFNLASIASAAPLNLSCAINQVILYYKDLAPDSDYIKDVNAVVKQAESYLNHRVSENNRSNHPAKLAIVFDIDDTSLSNYPAIKREHFNNSPLLIDHRYHATSAPAIAPVLRLYREAIAKSVAVFFISVREPLTATEDLRSYTIQNLRNAGYQNWTTLYLPPQQLTSSKSAYKTKIRKIITESGYDIILNIGDQDSDLVGGYADKTFKLPNYLYSTSPTPCEPVSSCYH